jgi:DNA repair photolyase
MSDFDYSLNPYSGCSYGCTYCYAAFFVRDDKRREEWGNWVLVKENALEVLRKMKTDLRDKTIYMSSVTDPYQPIERRLRLVRGLLEELVDRGARLVVQTRSPLVVRDLDILAKFEHVRVNMTLGTDSRKVHKIFEPHCASPRVRLRAIQKVQAAGIRSCITLTPLLPLSNPTKFVQDLKATNVTHFVVQPFHLSRGKFVAGTRPEALRIAAEMEWTEDKYRDFVRLMRDELQLVEEGRAGFAPE